MVDEEARTIEVVCREGRVRKRDAVVARAGFDEARPRVVGDELVVAGVAVKLGRPDAEAVMDTLVGPKRSKVVQQVGDAAKSFLEARARAMEFSAGLKERPREALFRAKVASPGGAEESVDSTQSSLAGEAKGAFESLRTLLAGDRGGLTPSGANKVWAAVHAMCLIQDSVRSKDGNEAGEALAFLDKLSPDGRPPASEVIPLGLLEATARLSQGAFARIALGDKDWSA
ncbi:MAG: hypothetical protein JRN06_07255 [Nitrososphaerota archaeon]|nr:hypothetical protein [Nitrososphaerota archaeon]MDG7024422.1 hypothetical protein [Nitrososphaerota archaeon]